MVRQVGSSKKGDSQREPKAFQDYRPVLDVARNFGAFAVVVVHLSQYPGEKDPIIARVLDATYLFRVPLFLAIAFYLFSRFSIRKPTWAEFFVRVRLIVIPYLLWSLIYIGLILANPEKRSASLALRTTLRGWVDIIFFGGAYGHLYYIPIVVSGMLLTFLLGRLVPSKGYVYCLIGVVLLDLILLQHPNSIYGSWRERSFVSRILYSINTCTPFVASGLCLALPRVQHWLNQRTWWGAAFFGVSAVALAILHNQDDSSRLNNCALFLVPVLLIVAILKLPSPTKKSASSYALKCYFGIYLGHFFVTTGVLWVDNRFGTGILSICSVGQLIFAGSVVFFISWAVAFVGSRIPVIGSSLFGCRSTFRWNINVVEGLRSELRRMTAPAQTFFAFLSNAAVRILFSVIWLASSLFLGL